MENAHGGGDLGNILHAIHGRYSSNPMDKVCALAFPLRRGEEWEEVMELPIYDPNTPISVAWAQMISCITLTKMSSFDFYTALLDMLATTRPTMAGKLFRNLLRKMLGKLFRKDIRPPRDRINDLVQLKLTPPIQLLRLFPHPSRHHWFPSWTQVQKYPDVSVRDNDQDSDLVLVAGGLDYSLRIMSGRIYCGCSLQLIQPPTPETKAVYCCTMDGSFGKGAPLVATVPGVELPIDTRSKYVLVDISPDRSLWPDIYDETYDSPKCNTTGIGHEHLPIWQESMIIICEEVDTLPQPAANTVHNTKNLSAIMQYRLRRVTTLEWDCRLKPNSSLPGPGRWLPFKPSLMHMRAVVCSTKGRSGHVLKLLDPEPDVFCDPAVVADMLRQAGEDSWYSDWDKRYPSYEVYLV